jgi:hypothetical protein
VHISILNQIFNRSLSLVSPNTVCMIFLPLRRWRTRKKKNNNKKREKKKKKKKTSKKLNARRKERKMALVEDDIFGGMIDTLGETLTNGLSDPAVLSEWLDALKGQSQNNVAAVDSDALDSAAQSWLSPKRKLVHDDCRDVKTLSKALRALAGESNSSGNLFGSSAEDSSERLFGPIFGKLSGNSSSTLIGGDTNGHRRRKKHVDDDATANDATDDDDDDDADDEYVVDKDVATAHSPASWMERSSGS